jgi:hypothetical protein
VIAVLVEVRHEDGGPLVGEQRAAAQVHAARERAAEEQVTIGPGRDRVAKDVAVALKAHRPGIEAQRLALFTPGFLAADTGKDCDETQGEQGMFTHRADA